MVGGDGDDEREARDSNVLGAQFVSDSAGPTGPPPLAENIVSNSPQCGGLVFDSSPFLLSYHTLAKYNALTIRAYYRFN